MVRIAVVLVTVGLVAGACGGGTAVSDIIAGDCFDDPSGSVVRSLELVDCRRPHDNEVFANLVISESVFPGDDVIRDFAFETCLEPFESYVGVPYSESPLDYTFIGPTQESWDGGDRTVTCVLYSADLAKLTESARAP